MRYMIFLCLCFIPLFFGCATPRIVPVHYLSDVLEVKSLTDRVFVHTSFLETKSYGKVPCNGMIYLRGGEAVVMDTPVDAVAAGELIRWIEEERQARVIAVVPTHFHVDCLGSLEVFHEGGIPSYAHALTRELAGKAGAVVPQNEFSELLTLEVGNREVVCQHFGAGHTLDNTVVYVPDEDVLFGGCLLKSLGSGKGNLADADTTAWPMTVQKIQAKYPGLKHVIPGHGKTGNADLLDYTIELFQKK